MMFLETDLYLQQELIGYEYVVSHIYIYIMIPSIYTAHLCAKVNIDVSPSWYLIYFVNLNSVHQQFSAKSLPGSGGTAGGICG